MVSARGAIDGTDIIAQVAKTCHHPITETPGNCISITGYQKPASLHHSRATDYSLAVILVLVPAAKLHCLACVKNHLRVKDLFRHNL
jgi:hypothetical protein